MTKKFAFILITFCILYGHNANAQDITLGYVDFPPYEFEEKGKPSGVLVSILEKIFKKADVPLKLKFLPFKRALESTKKGEINGLFNFYKNDERLKFFDYTIPIIENPLVIFVRKGSKIKFKKLEDLKGLKGGVINGYTYGAEFDQSPLFTRDKVNSHESNFKKLKGGRIDFYPVDKLVGIHVAKKNNLMSEFKILPTPLKVMDGYIGFTKGKNKKVIDSINKVIKNLHDSGEIEKTINQYIKKSTK